MTTRSINFSLLTAGSGTTSIADECSLACIHLDGHGKDIFRKYHALCTRKDWGTGGQLIQCEDVLLKDTDVARALIEYTSQMAIVLVLGSSTKTCLRRRFKVADIPGTVVKGAPNFCTVYVIAKEKIQSLRSGSRSAPAMLPLEFKLNLASIKPDLLELKPHDPPPTNYGHERQSIYVRSIIQDETESLRLPFSRRSLNGKSEGEISIPCTDISLSSSGRPIAESYDSSGTEMSNTGVSSSSERDENFFEALLSGRRPVDISTPLESAPTSPDGDTSSKSRAMVRTSGQCAFLFLHYLCSVYDYMANGSLEDRLFRRGNTPSLSWQLRFKIAAEIGTCLLFLHQRLETS